MPDYGDHVIVGNRKVNLILPDAELTLSSDNFPKFKTITAYSMWFGGTYKSMATLMEARKAAEGKLNANMADWQRSIAPPAFLQYGVRDPETGETALIYGRVPDIEEFILSEKGAGGRIGPDAEKFARRLRDRMHNALERGWLYGEWFSKSNLLGTWGAIHKTAIQEILSEARFKELEANGWDPDALKLI